MALIFDFEGNLEGQTAYGAGENLPLPHKWRLAPGERLIRVWSPWEAPRSAIYARLPFEPGGKDRLGMPRQR